jgi:hypothetical protein
VITALSTTTRGLPVSGVFVRHLDLELETVAVSCLSPAYPLFRECC